MTRRSTRKPHNGLAIVAIFALIPLAIALAATPALIAANSSLPMCQYLLGTGSKLCVVG